MKKITLYCSKATIRKSIGEDGKPLMVIGGIASTSAIDYDGQRLRPEGCDMSYFLNHGVLNYNHNSGSPLASAIGRPIKERCGITDDGIYIECLLYSDNPVAVEAYDLMEIMKDDPERDMCFSIEGDPVEADPDNQDDIIKWKMTNCALTPTPKNTEAKAFIIKSIQYLSNDATVVSDITDTDGNQIIVYGNGRIIKKSGGVETELNKGNSVALQVKTSPQQAKKNYGQLLKSLLENHKTIAKSIKNPLLKSLFANMKVHKSLAPLVLSMKGVVDKGEMTPEDEKELNAQAEEAIKNGTDNPDDGGSEAAKLAQVVKEMIEDETASDAEKIEALRAALPHMMGEKSTKAEGADDGKDDKGNKGAGTTKGTKKGEGIDGDGDHPDAAEDIALFEKLMELADHDDEDVRKLAETYGKGLQSKSESIKAMARKGIEDLHAKHVGAGGDDGKKIEDAVAKAMKPHMAKLDALLKALPGAGTKTKTDNADDAPWKKEIELLKAQNESLTKALGQSIPGFQVDKPGLNKGAGGVASAKELEAETNSLIKAVQTKYGVNPETIANFTVNAEAAFGVIGDLIQKSHDGGNKNLAHKLKKAVEPMNGLRQDQFSPAIVTLNFGQELINELMTEHKLFVC